VLWLSVSRRPSGLHLFVRRPPRAVDKASVHSAVVRRRSSVYSRPGTVLRVLWLFRSHAAINRRSDCRVDIARPAAQTLQPAQRQEQPKALAGTCLYSSRRSERAGITILLQSHIGNDRARGVVAAGPA